MKGAISIVQNSATLIRAGWLKNRSLNKWKKKFTATKIEKVNKGMITLNISRVCQINGTQRLGLAAVLEFMFVQPGLKSIRITDDEDKNKSPIEFGQPGLLLIANKKMRIYSSASIAANPM